MFRERSVKPGDSTTARSSLAVMPQGKDSIDTYVENYRAVAAHIAVSGIGSPVVFVSKPDSSLHMCIDYSALNKQTVKNMYPLYRREHLSDQLPGATIFTSIDLQSAYHQVRLKLEDVPKTAFTTSFGLFEC